MNLDNKLKLTLVVALIGGNFPMRAQQYGLEYQTEWQTDFNGGYNWVNILRLSGDVSLGQSLSFRAATISVAKTRVQPLVDDLQGFSNIEEDNLPLAIAVLGAEARMGNSTFFLGIRNVNEDYFTSDVTAFFLNSSCGIFPTLSANYDIANYPLSSWCLHYKAELGNAVVQTSVYEGRGHRNMLGHDNVFKISPRECGLFSITSAEYVNDTNNYSLGCAVHYGVRSGDEDGGGAPQTIAPSEKTRQKKVSLAPWANIEQRVAGDWHLMLQGSMSFNADCCKQYFGAGVGYFGEKIQAGVFADYAKFDVGTEKVLELTCRVPIDDHLSVQPAVEIINSLGQTSTIGIIRLSYSL